MSSVAFTVNPFCRLRYLRADAAGCHTLLCGEMCERPHSNKKGVHRRRGLRSHVIGGVLHFAR
jgi:hypothetical protein